MIEPSILKAKTIKGKTLVFKNASIHDAAFILSLRTNDKKSRFLTETSSDFKKQQDWLELYQLSRNQAYFVIYFNEAPCGTVRLYDANKLSFCWGSWILSDFSPHYAAIESALIVYSYAIDFLGFESSHFDVRKTNVKVWNFHERFGAKRLYEDGLNYFYAINASAIQKSIERYKKFLPRGIVVEPFI